MGDPIKVGDLVMVVRGNSCCGVAKRMGTAFTVQALERDYGTFACKWCGAPHGDIDVAKSEGGWWIEVRKLRRIDPPALGEYEGAPVRRKAKA